jgi:type VI secretion system protein ImpF
MSTSAKKDRLSPPLMLAFRTANAARDAKRKIDLRNEHGERLISGRRVTGRTPISETVLRTEVARDLESLMNTVAFESTEDLAGFPHVQRSILNYGFPDIAHRSIDEISVDDLAGEIRTVLMTYEPRLDRGSIRAVRDTSARVEELKLRFLVHADLQCDPLNIPVEFVADVDLENGGIHINRL